MSRIFLLSPASTSGRRAAMLLRPESDFDLALRLRSGGAPLGEVFSFLSGLYFRGKLTYATRFAGAHDLVRVITSDRGLADPASVLTLLDLQSMAASTIDHRHAPYRELLIRDAQEVVEAFPEIAALLLGSVATDKYVSVLHTVFADRLLFPIAFTGRGDMSRGGMLLRCASAGTELDYSPVMTSPRRGHRPPRL